MNVEKHAFLKSEVHLFRMPEFIKYTNSNFPVN